MDPRNELIRLSITIARQQDLRSINAGIRQAKSRHLGSTGAMVIFGALAVLIGGAALVSLPTDPSALAGLGMALFMGAIAYGALRSRQKAKALLVILPLAAAARVIYDADGEAALYDLIPADS